MQCLQVRQHRTHCVLDSQGATPLARVLRTALGGRTETRSPNPPNAQSSGNLDWNDRDALVCDMDTHLLSDVKASLLQPVPS